MISGEEIAGAGFLALFGGYWLSFTAVIFRRRRAESRMRRQVGRARAAAQEAALEDQSFSPAQICDAVIAALRFVERTLNREPQTLVPERPDAPVLYQMAGGIQRMARGPSRWVLERPVIDILRVVNRPGEVEDRVLVRVRLVVDERLGQSVKLPVLGLDQRWTLARGRVNWVVLSIDWEPLATVAVARPSIASPSADDDRLYEQSLTELARADAHPPGIVLDHLVARDAPVHQRLLDVAQVDGRFAPLLVAATVQHIVEVWEEAATGSSQPLQLVASTSAAIALLRPQIGDRSASLILRDAKLERWKLTEIFLDFEGLPDRNTQYLLGFLVCQQGDVSYHAFWADTDAAEARIWDELLTALAAYPDAPLYHYGQYEARTIKVMLKRYQSAADGLLGRLVNLNAYVYGRVYFPVRSNRLKDIGRWLGVSWPTAEASGFDSMVWRHRWYESHDDADKQLLLA